MVNGNRNGSNKECYSSVAVERTDNTECLLIATIPQHFEYRTGKYDAPVLPGQVAAIIRAALAAGWQAGARGKPFIMRQPLE